MSDHQITLTTRDGHELTFSCEDNLDVVSAGEHASILLPSLCRDGGCGACLGHCSDGEYTLGDYSPGVLSEQAVSKRDVLLCRTYPQTDLKITAPYDYAHINFNKHEARQAVITGLEPIADRTVRLKLQWQNEQDEGKAVEFEPGQCMELEIPGTGIRRAYSLANTGNWRGEMEFLIRLQPEGKFSGYLGRDAQLGQVLKVYGPNGAFGLQADSLDPAVFIAGGTGLAPFLSILRRLAEWGEDRAIHLLFGVNRESELFYIDELSRLQECLPGLTVTLCVWQPDSGWSGFSGTPADALQQYFLDYPGDYDVYLCGPPLLVTAATEVALARGIAEQRIFSEKFG
ncbi:MAG: 2Fe-2S iron-sulfur cluster binding domain-containing protein [Gammaproteobacteria bacterium]